MTAAARVHCEGTPVPGETVKRLDDGTPIVNVRDRGDVLVLSPCPFCRGDHLHSKPAGYRGPLCPPWAKPPSTYYLAIGGRLPAGVR